MVRPSNVLSVIDVTIRRVADNENITPDERIRVVDWLLDIRAAFLELEADTTETRTA